MPKDSITPKITKQRITLFIRPSLVKHARAQAVVEEISLARIVEKALISYLPKETIIKKVEFSTEANP